MLSEDFVLFGLVCRRVSDAVREKLGDASHVSLRKSDTDGFADTKRMCPWATMRLVQLHILAAVRKNKDQICSSWLIRKLVWNRTTARLRFFFLFFQVPYSSGSHLLCVVVTIPKLCNSFPSTRLNHHIGSCFSTEVELDAV